MKRFVLYIVIAAVLIACYGCWRKSANSVDDANANVAAESPFANITDANEALAEGNRLFEEGQTDMAIEAFRQAVKLNPDLAEAYFKLGIAYLLLEKQIKTDTDPGTSPADDKNALRSEKAFQKAVEAYKKWVAANPNDDAAYYNLGRSYSKLNKDDEAEKALRQAAKLKPDDTEYQTELGAILIRLAKYHEALIPLKRAIELDEANSRAIDLLDDAEAGAKRLDYVAPKNTNQSSNVSTNANVNANMSSSNNANSASKPPPANTKPVKDNKPPHGANRPN
jgi:tetratricopeptide (TPR) repeat protein